MTVMTLISRGSSASTKHLMLDISKLTVSRRETKFDSKDELKELQELMDMNECDSVLYFHTTKRTLTTWMSYINGPSIKLTTFDYQTMLQLSFCTNFLKQGGHVLLFTQEFDEKEELKIFKEISQKVFVSKTEIDRVISFFYYNNMIWMRNYVVGDEIQEIGPRIVFQVEKVLKKCFSGEVIYNRNKEI
ncbi:Brix domain-containing protein [Hamiltosporidium magnivora]|uniref:Brix domain-containing protein n=1 Tax=Hamiltosporidium magnivora TaxID=148818 RepID=A0A4Q9KSF5_9MICR|nr:Brix domain-containing protein [Hamiltosporidium magnivora]